MRLQMEIDWKCCRLHHLRPSVVIIDAVAVAVVVVVVVDVARKMSIEMMRG